MSNSRLTDQEFMRYNRHVMVDKLGEQGQLILKQAHVLIVGLGGLGCPAAQYLAASGVGRLTLVDHDIIEISNLQRQILFTQEDIGQSKVTVAKQRLQTQNPFVSINTIDAPIEEIFDHTIHRSWSTFDLVLDCSDNQPTRLFINKQCAKAAVPLVSAAAIQGKGQLMSFDYAKHNSPCYQCLFPDTDVQTKQSCQHSGVLSTLLAVVGGLQANLALLTLLGKNPKLNTLLTIDAFSLEQKEFVLTTDPDCPNHDNR